MPGPIYNSAIVLFFNYFYYSKKRDNAPQEKGQLDFIKYFDTLLSNVAVCPRSIIIRMRFAH